MRTDRASFVETESLWRLWPELYAGLYPKDIDAHGGINLNKISAYLGLVTGASERWKLKDGSYFDIDRCIVVKDIESHVTCTMDHIDTEYNIDRGLHTEKVNQCDGVGYILPCACEASDPPVDNFMVRSPFLKGLLSKFDYLAFARENDCPAVATDVWGQEHDLIAEDIQVVFTESQLKLWSYYDSWDDYKNRWHENNCYLCRTNYEEDNIPDSEWNYQMIQTLLDMTDEELDTVIKKDYDEIDNIDSNVKTQLKAFGCYNGREKSALQKCLLAYPPLLRDGYCREQLKDIKKSKIFDGKAGRLHIRNKRLFAVPDPYAAFERIFLHVEEPEGLLKFGEICTNEPSYNRVDEVDLLRSPHLHIEHATRRLNKDPKVHKWLTTKAVYTSFKDIASRILQFEKSNPYTVMYIE